MNESTYLLVGLSYGKNFISKTRHKIICEFMTKSVKTHYTKLNDQFLFNCGLIIPCTWEDYESKDVVLYIASDEGLLHKPKPVAKFVYRCFDNNSKPTFGPTLVNFYYGSKGDVYGQIELFIVFVERYAVFYQFPKTTGLSQHCVALSVTIKTVSLFKDIKKNLELYCELYVNKRSVGYTQPTKDNKWNYRILISNEYYKPSNNFIFALQCLENDKYLGEVSMKCMDLFSNSGSSKVYTIINRFKRIASITVECCIVKYDRGYPICESGEHLERKNRKGFRRSFRREDGSVEVRMCSMPSIVHRIESTPLRDIDPTLVENLQNSSYMETVHTGIDPTTGETVYYTNGDIEASQSVEYDENGYLIQYDENGEPYFQYENGDAVYYNDLNQSAGPMEYDENGNPIEYDEDGHIVLFDENGEAYYEDENGNVVYYDDQIDENGNVILYDENGIPFYHDANGNAVYYDGENRQVYDEDNESHSGDEVNTSIAEASTPKNELHDNSTNAISSSFATTSEAPIAEISKQESSPSLTQSLSDEEVYPRNNVAKSPKTLNHSLLPSNRPTSHSSNYPQQILVNNPSQHVSSSIASGIYNSLHRNKSSGHKDTPAHVNNQLNRLNVDDDDSDVSLNEPSRKGSEKSGSRSSNQNELNYLNVDEDSDDGLHEYKANNEGLNRLNIDDDSDVAEMLTYKPPKPNSDLNHLNIEDDSDSGIQTYKSRANEDGLNHLNVDDDSDVVNMLTYKTMEGAGELNHLNVEDDSEAGMNVYKTNINEELNHLNFDDESDDNLNSYKAVNADNELNHLNVNDDSDTMEMIGIPSAAPKKSSIDMTQNTYILPSDYSNKDTPVTLVGDVQMSSIPQRDFDYYSNKQTAALSPKSDLLNSLSSQSYVMVNDDSAHLSPSQTAYAQNLNRYPNNLSLHSPIHLDSSRPNQLGNNQSGIRKQRSLSNSRSGTLRSTAKKLRDSSSNEWMDSSFIEYIESSAPSTLKKDLSASDTWSIKGYANTVEKNNDSRKIMSQFVYSSGDEDGSSDDVKPAVQAAIPYVKSKLEPSMSQNDVSDIIGNSGGKYRITQSPDGKTSIVTAPVPTMRPGGNPILQSMGNSTTGDSEIAIDSDESLHLEDVSLLDLQ